MKRGSVYNALHGLVAELADAHDLGSCPARGGGSSPLRPTKNHIARLAQNGTFSLPQNRTLCFTLLRVEPPNTRINTAFSDLLQCF
jgi:hypothetical protein